MCYNYQRRRGEVHAAILNESSVHTDQQVQMHSFVTRPNLPAIRTQLAHLDQGFDREGSIFHAYFVLGKCCKLQLKL